MKCTVWKPGAWHCRQCTAREQRAPCTVSLVPSSKGNGVMSNREDIDLEATSVLGRSKEDIRSMQPETERRVKSPKIKILPYT